MSVTRGATGASGAVPVAAVVVVVVVTEATAGVGGAEAAGARRTLGQVLLAALRHNGCHVQDGAGRGGGGHLVRRYVVHLVLGGQAQLVPVHGVDPLPNFSGGRRLGKKLRICK